MEQERANRGVGFFSYAATRGFSPIAITAAISGLILLAAVGWELIGPKNSSPPTASSVPVASATAGSDSPLIPQALEQGTTSTNSSQATTSTDIISDIGPAVINELQNTYANLNAQGTYTPEQGQQAGEDLAQSVVAPVSYPAFADSDIKTDSDTSYQRMLAYRSDLQKSLMPLLQNSTPEYEIFGDYVETKDPSYLSQLEKVAGEYQLAASSSAKIVVPQDALPYHIAILNAMEEFASTLDELSTHADDPFASVALLRTYDQAESDMLTSFNALYSYERAKQP